MLMTGWLIIMRTMPQPLSHTKRLAKPWQMLVLPEDSTQSSFQLTTAANPDMDEAAIRVGSPRGEDVEEGVEKAKVVAKPVAVRTVHGRRAKSLPLPSITHPPFSSPSEAKAYASYCAKADEDNACLFPLWQERSH